MAKEVAGREEPSDVVTASEQVNPPPALECLTQGSCAGDQAVISLRQFVDGLEEKSVTLVIDQGANGEDKQAVSRDAERPQEPFSIAVTYGLLDAIVDDLDDPGRHPSGLQHPRNRMRHSDISGCLPVFSPRPSPNTKVQSAVNHNGTLRHANCMAVGMRGMGGDEIGTEVGDGFDQSNRGLERRAKVGDVGVFQLGPKWCVGSQHDSCSRRHSPHQVQELGLATAPLPGGVDVKNPHLPGEISRFASSATRWGTPSTTG